MAITKIGKTYRAEVFVKGVRILAKAGFKTKSLAKAWHDKTKLDFQCSSQESILQRNTNEKRSFTELAEAFIENHVKHHVKFRTARRYVLDIRHRIIPFFSTMQVASINSSMIYLFQNKLSASGLSARSVNHSMVIVNSIFQKGLMWGLCNHNPCAGVRPLKVSQKPFRWWQSVDHIIQFLTANQENHYYTLFKFALESGLRLGEIIGLTKEAVDYGTGRIVVYQQYDPEQKKSVSLKNDKIRYVWVNDDLLFLLKQMKTTNSESKFVFTDEKGHIIEATKLSQRIFKAAQLRACVPLINFHGLRHTYASHYMMNGGSLYDLKALLGHSAIEMTERYAHLSLDSLQKTKTLVNFNLGNVEGIFKKSLKNHAF